MSQDKTSWEEQDSFLAGQIERTVGQIQRVEWFAMGAQLATLALAGILIGIFLDHWVFSGGLSVKGRLVVAFGVLFVLLVTLIRRMIPLLIRRVNPLFAASVLEGGRGNKKNFIINWFLLRNRSDDPKTNSTELGRAVLQGVVRQANEEVSELPDELPVDHSAIIRWGIVFTCLVAVLAVYSIVSPKNPITSIERLFFPVSKIQAPLSVQFLEIKPGDVSIFAGDTMVIEAEIAGVGKKPVFFSWTTDDRRLVDRTLPMEFVSGNMYKLLFPTGVEGLTEPISYRVLVGLPGKSENYSPSYRVTVRQPMAIAVERLKISFPEYTNHSPLIVENSGDIRALWGSTIEVVARANAPLKSAFFLPRQNEELARTMALDASDPLRARLTFIPQKENDVPSQEPTFAPHDTWSILCHDQKDNANRSPAVYSLEMYDDLPPNVTWESTPDGQPKIPLNSSFSVKVRVEDPDFGLTGVTLAVSPRLQQDNRQATLLVRDQAARNIDLLAPGTDKPLTGEHVLSGTVRPSELKLTPGLEYEYRVIACDGKTPQPNKTLSPIKSFTVVAPSDKPEESEPQSNQPSNQPSDQNKDVKQGGDKDNSGQSDSKQKDDKSDSGQGQSESTQDKSTQDKSTQDKSSGGSSKEADSSQGGQGKEDNKDSGKQKDDKSDSGQGQSESTQDKSTQDKSTQDKSSGGSSKEADSSQGGQGKEDNKDGGKQKDDKSDSGQGQGESAQDKSTQDKSAQDKSAQDKSTQDKSAQDKSTQDKSSGGSSKEDDSSQGGQSKEGKQDGGKQNNKEGKNGGSGSSEPNSSEDAKSNSSSGSAKQNEKSGKKSDSTLSSDRNTSEGKADDRGDTDKDGKAGGTGKQDDKNQEKSKSDSDSGPIDPDANPGDAFERIMDHMEQTNQGTAGQKKEQNTTGQELQNPPASGAKSSNSQGKEVKGPAPDELSQGLKREQGKVSPDSKDLMTKQTEGKIPAEERKVSPDSRVVDDPDHPVQGEQAEGPSDGMPSVKSKNPENFGKNSELVDSSDAQKRGEGSSSEKPTMDANDLGINSDQAGHGGQHSDTVVKSPSKENAQGEQKNQGEQGKQNEQGKQGEQKAQEKNGAQAKQSDQKQQGNPTGAGASDAGAGEKGDHSPGNQSIPGGAHPAQSPQGNSESPQIGGGHASASSAQDASGKALADDPNIKYTEQATDLVLEYLEDQVKDKVDPALLHKLGWSEDQLKQFLTKWKSMKENARKSGATKDDSVSYLESLRNIGLKSGRKFQKQTGGTLSDKEQRSNAEDTRFAPPPSFKDRFRAFNRGISKEQNH